MNTPTRNTWIPSIGDSVHYHPVIGQEHTGRVYPVRAIEDGHGGTRCRVWLEGKSGFVAIEALSPAPSTEGLDFEPDEQHGVADMANVGFALMQEIVRNMPGYTYNDSPAEVVCDLINERDEARERYRALEEASAELADNTERLLEKINGLHRAIGLKA